MPIWSVAPSGTSSATCCADAPLDVAERRATRTAYGGTSHLDAEVDVVDVDEAVAERARHARG